MQLTTETAFRCCKVVLCCICCMFVGC